MTREFTCRTTCSRGCASTWPSITWLSSPRRSRHTTACRGFSRHCASIPSSCGRCGRCRAPDRAGEPARRADRRLQRVDVGARQSLGGFRIGRKPASLPHVRHHFLAVLTRGNGAAGTGRRGRSTTACQPSFGEKTSSRSGGRASITAWLRRLNQSVMKARSPTRPPKASTKMAPFIGFDAAYRRASPASSRKDGFVTESNRSIGVAHGQDHLGVRIEGDQLAPVGAGGIVRGGVEAVEDEASQFGLPCTAWSQSGTLRRAPAKTSAMW